jgi:hypothetical protein
MKPGSSSTGWPSPRGSWASAGQVNGSTAISASARHSISECSRLGAPVWG